MAIIYKNTDMTIKEVITTLQSFLDNKICDENVKVLFGRCDSGNCVTNIFYNNSNTQPNAPWFGEFVILNH